MMLLEAERALVNIPAFTMDGRTGEASVGNPRR
jgi:hypothetical protein